MWKRGDARKLASVHQRVGGEANRHLFSTNLPGSVDCEEWNNLGCLIIIITQVEHFRILLHIPCQRSEALSTMFTYAYGYQGGAKFSTRMTSFGTS